MIRLINEQKATMIVDDKDELAVLERVYKKFANFGSVDISKYSHNEKGYSKTKPGEIISYSYAKDIQFD